LITLVERRFVDAKQALVFEIERGLAVAFPVSNNEVCRLVSTAAEHKIALVPSGGRTGLSGGAVAASGEVVVSFDRMRQIIDFDPLDRTVTVQAGVVTQSLQDHAIEHGLYYPVRFASQGSSQIGGNLATNAGGVRVLRYGLTRDWVAGLKFVDGTGTLIDCNSGLIKNASGYDLRHLLIGSEGTLGLIVEATLRYTDMPPPSRVMLLGLNGVDSLMDVFGLFRSRLSLSAFEFFSDRALGYVCRENELPAPLDADCPYYCLVEFDCSGGQQEDDALDCFSDCTAAGWLKDGVMSQSDTQAADLWRYREGISESFSALKPYKFDLSVRISRVPGYMQDLEKLLAARYPDFEVLIFGHIGDGNLHLGILKPESVPLPVFEKACESASQAVFSLTRSVGGSISAEHGIGLLKQPYLEYVRSEVEIGHMLGIKRQFDPSGILNPGKLLPRVEHPG
jgi:FAD/FMN-containing dehydrogenase